MQRARSLLILPQLSRAHSNITSLPSRQYPLPILSTPTPTPTRTMSSTSTPKYSGPTFSNQPALPRLPIPPLEASCTKYLKSLRPLLTDTEYAHSEKAVAEFIKPNGLGHTLQSRLLAHDKGEKNSWLERWWLVLAYHSWRESVLINSNWFILFRDHPNHPKELLTDGSSKRVEGRFSEFQIYRAAGVISNYLNYKEMLEKQLLPPEGNKDGPLCMNQYSQMFGVTRVPAPGCDYNVQHSSSKHIIVSARDQFFVVQVYDSLTGDRVPIKMIENQLWAVVEDVEKNTADRQPPIGLLTGEHRDTWSKAREHLVQLNDLNKHSLSLIETALFGVALDDYPVPVASLEGFSKNVFHGRAGRNRWFDKSLYVVVSNDGRVGMNGEHSPCDALVPSFLVDFAAKHEPAVDHPDAKPNAILPKPRKLIWKVDATAEKYLSDAQTFVNKLITDSDLALLHFKEYGTNSIKKFARVSPDAFIQMAMQVAYYRMHGYCPATYETASARKFLHGRTETCRTLSIDSLAFVKTFQDTNQPSSAKLSALQKACSSHVKYIVEAMNGQGCDRHLLGLRMVMKPGENAGIFNDPAYKKSTNFLLSTSGLSAGERFLGTGFGAVSNDGYGINYMAGPEMIKFGIESKRSCKNTGSEGFKRHLAEVLVELRRVCGEAVGVAKL